MQTKERGSRFRKDKDNLRQPNLTTKNKGVWIQQNKGGELKDSITKNGSCNTEINEGRSLEVGKEDMPDKEEHSGKDNVDHNGEDFLPKESIQHKHIEKILGSSPHEVLEVSSDIEPNEVSNYLGPNHIAKAQEMQCEVHENLGSLAKAINFTNQQLRELDEGQGLRISSGVQEPSVVNHMLHISQLNNLNDEDDENGFSISSEDVSDDGIDESSSLLDYGHYKQDFESLTVEAREKSKSITPEMMAVVHKNIHSQGEIIPSMLGEEIQKALKLRGVYSRDDYVKRSSLHEQSKSFYSDGKEAPE
ncbi:unnamed protein product, partial [Ilex paraguariensis]